MRRRVLLTYELRRDENKMKKKSSSLIKMKKKIGTVKQCLKKTPTNRITCVLIMPYALLDSIIGGVATELLVRCMANTRKNLNN